MITLRPAKSAWRSLARRGMLSSECEAVETVGLPPYGGLDLERPDGVEKLWLVTGGGGRTGTTDIGSGDLVLTSAMEGIRFQAGTDGLELLLIAVTPAVVSEALPTRRPVT